MRFRSYDTLNTFDVVARCLSITEAAEVLNQSKGSISYQINKLETDLGFSVFHRANARISLTEAGRRLWHVSQTALGQIDREIADLRGATTDTLTVAMLTYFSSRWLSPRLTRFFEGHPGMSLRIEPISSAEMLKAIRPDLAVLWGIGDWPGLHSELLFNCPAVPTANPDLAAQVREMGLETALKTLPLLGDSSGDAGWRAWHAAAGLDYNPSRTSLTIPDSNSRVQAVIDGQGIALWDALVKPEIDEGALVPVADIWLAKAGYYSVFPSAEASPAALRFLDWLKGETTPETLGALD